MKTKLILFFVATATALAALEDGANDKANLLVNPAFEDGNKGWDFSAWRKQGRMEIDTTEKHTGGASLRIDNPFEDDSFPRQTVKVKPDTRYRMTGFIKTKDVLIQGTGASLAVEGKFEKTANVSGSQGWTKISFDFDSGTRDSVKVGPRLGHHGREATGTAWFDDLSLVEVGPTAVEVAKAEERARMEARMKEVLADAERRRAEMRAQMATRWERHLPVSVIGEWRGTHPDWSDTLTIRADGTMEVPRQNSTGKWTLTAEGGTPMLVFRWDRFGTESLLMIGTTYFRGKTRNGGVFELRRVIERPAER